jgi:hypothetical protein
MNVTAFNFGSVNNFNYNIGSNNIPNNTSSSFISGFNPRASHQTYNNIQLR